MLAMKDDKSLVPSVETPSENIFACHILKSDSDGSQGMNVQMDMESKAINCYLSSGENKITLLLNPNQAVSLGMWLAEAGHILNFAKSVNLTFTEEEESDE